MNTYQTMQTVMTVQQVDAFSIVPREVLRLGQTFFPRPFVVDGDTADAHGDTLPHERPVRFVGVADAIFGVRLERDE